MAREKISGIYKIINLVNNKFYIGSSINIYSRWSKHKNLLRKNQHKNKHLQSAWNKYTEDSFEFIIIDKMQNNDDIQLRKELLQREGYWINLLTPYIKEIGYNVNIKPNSRSGLKESEETKRKKSIAMLKPHHQERQAKLMKEIRQNRSILNNDQVLEIVELINNNISDDKIAELYNVTSSAIGDIRRGRNWGNVTKISYVKHHTRLSKEEKINIIKYIKLGLTNKNISDLVDRTPATVREFRIKYANMTSDEMLKYGLVDEIL